MNRQLRQMASSCLAWMIMVGLLGSGQVGMANISPTEILQGFEFENQPNGLHINGNPGQNFDLVGHLGGEAQAVEVVGDYAYVGFGPELAILDISDPAHIQRIGWLVAAGEVMEIVIEGDYAYIAYRNVDMHGVVGSTGLEIVDIHNPELPFSLSIYELSECGENETVVIQGNSAYFAFTACRTYGGIISSGGAYIYRLDITHLTNPVILDSYNASDLPTMNGIAVSQGWLFALFAGHDEPRMVVFDISSARNLVETTSFQTIPLQYYGQDGVALSDEYALINGADNLLQVVDISDPTQPEPVITYTLPGQGKGIYTDATDAFIVLSTSSILILDASDPRRLVYRGAYQTTGLTHGFFVSGPSAYCANGEEGLEIFDMAGLSRIGLVRYPPNINDLIYADDFAYLTANDGFWTMDVSNPKLPFPAAYQETFYPLASLVLKGSFAYVASQGDGIRILDISNPIQPAYADSVYLPYHFQQLLLVDNTIYVAAGKDGLYILDISDPNNTQVIGSFVPEYKINAVSVSGDYAYLAVSSDNLIILDVSNPASPQEIGIYDPPDLFPDDATWGSAVSMQGNLVLFATIRVHPTPIAGYDDGTVWLVDVSNPKKPVHIGSISQASYGWAPYRITLKDSLAYILYERQGLNIYDISDPGSVQYLGQYNPSEYTYGMSLAGDEIYLYNQSVFLLRYLDQKLPAIGGVVSHANNKPYPGVLLSTGDQRLDQVSDLGGTYAFRGISDGTYSITPSLSGFVFSPTSHEVMVPPSTFSQNFTILPEPVEIDFTPGVSATLKYTDTQGLPSWLDIPAEISNMPLTIQLVPTMGARARDYAFAGHAFELNTRTGGSSLTGYTFERPVRMSISYSPQDIAVVTDPGSLVLWWWDGAAWRDTTQSCSPATEYVRDLDNHILSVPICQTGTYKLMGPTEQFYLPVISIGIR